MKKPTLAPKAIKQSGAVGRRSLKEYHRPLIGLIVLVLVLQVTFDVFVYVRAIDGAGDQTVIASLIIKAAEALKKPVVIDAQGNQYFPEARLTVPAVTLSAAGYNQLLYSYQPAVDSFPAELQVTTQAALSSSESRLLIAQSRTSFWHNPGQAKLYAQVPSFQACVRGVHVFFVAHASQASGYTLVASEALKDGRKIYIYTEQPQKCQLTLTNVVDQLKLAQSY